MPVEADLYSTKQVHFSQIGAVMTITALYAGDFLADQCSMRRHVNLPLGRIGFQDRLRLGVERPGLA